VAGLKFNRPVQLMTWLVLLSVCLAARALDHFSTWIVSPDLRFESNLLVKWLGWRRWIAASVLLCIACVIHPWRLVLSAIIVGWSVSLAIWNFLIFWRSSR
jgi:hypothetical protein